MKPSTFIWIAKWSLAHSFELQSEAQHILLNCKVKPSTFFWIAKWSPAHSFELQSEAQHILLNCKVKPSTFFWIAKWSSAHSFELQSEAQHILLNCKVKPSTFFWIAKWSPAHSFELQSGALGFLCSGIHFAGYTGAMVHILVVSWQSGINLLSIHLFDPSSRIFFHCSIIQEYSFWLCHLKISCLHQLLSNVPRKRREVTILD